MSCAIGPKPEAELVPRESLTLDRTPDCMLGLWRAFKWCATNILDRRTPLGRTALSIDAIRFYERRKLLPPAFRSAGRFRLYTADDIERLRFVQRIQRLGFSLLEIKQ